SAAEVAALLEAGLAHLRQPMTVPVPTWPTFSSVPTNNRPGRVAFAAAFLAFCGLLAVLGWGLASWQAAAGAGADNPEAAPALDVYQDFRKQLPLDSWVRLVGQDA